MASQAAGSRPAAWQEGSAKIVAIAVIVVLLAAGAIGASLFVHRTDVTTDWENGTYVGETTLFGTPDGQGEWTVKGAEEASADKDKLELLYYKGSWKDGVREGEGVANYAGNKRYRGTFANGLPNGTGYGTLPDGTRYYGLFVDGKPEGQGAVTQPDGSRYVGEFKNGLPNGQGTGTKTDGTRYIGSWVDGEFGGEGTLTLPDGKVLTGTWEKGEIKA